MESQNFKLAIILHGISYNHNTNYKKCIKNFFKNIYSPLSNKFNIDIFFITYNNIFNEDLITDYKPIKYKFNEFINKNNDMRSSMKVRAENLLQIIDILEKYEFEHKFTYNQILTIRFDINFYENITNYLIDFDKFNFVSYGEDYVNFDTDDNLYLFNRKYLDTFKLCYTKIFNNEIITHYISNILNLEIGMNNISFFFKDGIINNQHINWFIKWHNSNQIKKESLWELGKDIKVLDVNKEKFNEFKFDYTLKDVTYIYLRNRIYNFSRDI